MTHTTSDPRELEKIANRLRIKVIKVLGKFGYGHIGGSMSIAEIVAVLYFHEMNIDPKNPQFADRDRFILSKGHACFTQYAALAELGIISEQDLAKPYRVDSPIQAHPELGVCPGIEMTTGALGQGLSAGIGMTIGAKLREKSFRIYVVLGDGELDEGQVWEAAMLAPKYKLDNMVAIVDYNKHTLSGRTAEIMPLEPLFDKWIAFGWHAIQVNGHSASQLIYALDEARETKEDKPTVIIAQTVKGRGVAFLEDKWESHATTLTLEQTTTILKDLGCSESEIKTALF